MGRPTGIVGINEQLNDGKAQPLSSNEPLPICLPGQCACEPPSLPPFSFLEAVHCLTLATYSDHFVLVKNNYVLGISSLSPIIVFFWFPDPFSECRALAVYPIFWSCVIAAVCCLMAGFQDCHWTPPPAPPPLRLLALSMWKAPFPRHCSAGTAFTVKSVPMEIEWGKEGDREMM